MFTGRLMKCSKCGFIFKSDIKLDSMFTTVQIDDKLIDFCPFCWGIQRHLWPNRVKEEWDKFHLKKQAEDRKKGD